MESKKEQVDDEKAAPRIKSRNPSGFTYSWKLWRHCCCRYGTYPLLVAPIVTTGFLLSLYSSAGCDFVRVDVGFTPSNEAWNQSTAEIGLFYYQSDEPETNKYREAVVEGCRWYEDNFNEEFVENDRTWTVARMMAYISGCASLLATVSYVGPIEFRTLTSLLISSDVKTAGYVMAIRVHTAARFLFLARSLTSGTHGFVHG
jgi:hypothetical protein